MKHELYKDGDSNIPNSIKDSNGEVVLDMCKICGKAEADLSEDCIGNKYYTPKIEEFYVGFRYEEELKNPNWHKLIKPTEDTFEFVKMEFDTSKSISKIIQKIKQGKIRVKALDHDDIKEAGWEEKVISGNCGFWNKEKYSLHFNFETLIAEILLIEDGYNYTRFVGSIPNFNKLLEVMDMIGVERK